MATGKKWWFRQPPYPVVIDWSNPLTRGLAIACSPTFGNRNVANNRLATIGANATYPLTPQTSFTTSIFHGKVWLFDNSVATPGLDFGVQGANIPIKPGDKTFLIITDQLTGTGFISWGINTRTATGPNPIAYLNFNADATSGAYSSGFWGVQEYDGGSQWALPSATATMASGVMTAYAASRSGNAGTLYRNGVVVGGSPSGTGTFTPIASSRVAIGHPADYGSAGLGLTGRLLAAFYWNRALSDAEHMEMCSNPWQIFQSALPQDEPLFFGPAASTATSADIAAIDAPDVAAIVAENWTTAQVAAVDAPDVAAINTSVTTGASVAATDAPDVAAINAATLTTADIAVIDGADVTDVQAEITTGADIAATDTADLAAITADANVGITSATIDATDGADAAAIVVAATLGAAIDVTDGADIAAIDATVTTGASIAAIDGVDLSSIQVDTGTQPITVIASTGGGGGGGKRKVEKLVNELPIFKKLEARKPGQSIKEALDELDEEPPPKAQPATEATKKPVAEALAAPAVPLEPPEFKAIKEHLNEIKASVKALQAKATAEGLPIDTEEDDAEILLILSALF